MFELIDGDDVAILKMSRSKVNAMDLEFVTGLIELLQRVEAGPQRALVLASNCRAFSAGVDLLRLLAEDNGYLDDFLPALESVFEKLLQFPKPTVAAINGAAMAGGCVLACACDYRLIAQSAKIGIPELRVGVPLPTVALEIMRAVCVPQCFRQLVMSGRTCVGQAAVNAGLADQVADPEPVLEAAISMARQMLSIPPPVYALTKRQLQQPIIQKINCGRTSFAVPIDQLWRQDEIRREIRRYVEMTFKPNPETNQ